jgi:transposase
MRSAGALLIFLRPYSPDLKPIKHAFSKLKTLLRKENARTREQTTHCISTLLDRINGRGVR